MRKILFLIIIALVAVLPCYVAQRCRGKIKEEDGAQIVLIQNIRKSLKIGWLGLIYYYLILCAGVLILDGPAMYLFAGIFVMFLFLCSLLIWYALLWRGYITENFMIIKCPPFINRKIRLQDITRIKKTEFRMIGYADRKKLFTLEYDIVGMEKLQLVLGTEEEPVEVRQLIDMEELYRREDSVGRLEKAPIEECFRICSPMKEIVSCVVLFVIMASYPIAAVLQYTDSDPWMTSACALAAVLILYLLADYLILRIEVNYQTLTIRKLFHGTKEYDLREITLKPRGYGNGMRAAELYYGKKKIAALSDEYKNYYLLMRRLEDTEQAKENTF